MRPDPDLIINLSVGVIVIVLIASAAYTLSRDKRLVKRIKGQIKDITADEMVIAMLIAGCVVFYWVLIQIYNGL